MLQERAWNSVCPLVIKLKKFYSFSLRLGTITMQDKMSLLCTFSGSNNSFLHFNHSGLNGKLSILKRLQVSSCPNESWILELKVVFTCSNLKLDTWILSVCVCVWVCRGGSTEFVGVPDMSALHAHSAPGEGAGTGQTVCGDPPLHSALWWAEGLLRTMSRNTHTYTHSLGHSSLASSLGAIHLYEMCCLFWSGGWMCFYVVFLQMRIPAIQNDFSYYRRTISRNRINNMNVSCFIRLDPH